MYEVVSPHPAGSSTLRRYARTAVRHGYDGVVSLARYDGTDGDHERPRPAIDPASTAGDVVDGAVIAARDRERAAVALDRSRPEHTLVVCRAESTTLQRFVAERERVDVLLAPAAGDPIEHGILKTARDHGVWVAFDLHPVLHERGGERVGAIAALQRRKRLLEDAGADAVVTASPTDHLSMRSPRDLAALGASINLGGSWTREGLAAWTGLIERNRTRLADGFVEPGVHRGTPADRARGEDPENDDGVDG